jgi:hypothetical protein
VHLLVSPCATAYVAVTQLVTVTGSADVSTMWARRGEGAGVVCSPCDACA